MKIKQSPSVGFRFARGVSLIELMVALVLGLLVVGGAIGMFISNKQAYSATESVGRVQENSRLAFELMARDKKVERGGLRFVVLEALGRAALRGGIERSAIGAVLDGHTA